MKKQIIILQRLALSFALVLITCFNLMAQGKDSVTLEVGDKAPALNYGHWLKGTPVKEYKKDRLYLVEFWATWCGPCIQMMPHLSKIAREQANDVTVIGCNIWEGSHDTTGKPYDTYLPRITRFVKGMGKNMDYNVITDNNAQYMGNHWMKAAGQDGIPCTFMIKNGTILWIGHPIEIDSIINLVHKGNYDVAAEKKRRAEQRVAEANGPMKKFGEDITNVEKLVKEARYDKAYAIVDSGATTGSAMAGAYGFFKFQLLLEHFAEDTAMRFCRKWQATKPGYRLSTAAVIGSKDGLSKDTYQYALNIWKQGDGYNDKDGYYSPMTCDNMANLYAKMGDYNLAAEKEQLAINEGKQALKENKFPGLIMEATIKEYETKLAKYKNGGK